MKTSKKKWLYRALCAAMAVALVSGTAVMTPIADFVGTNITANAATDVSNASAFLTAVENGGEIKLADDISINQNVTISKECTIDFNGKKITFGGARNDKYHLEVNAPTTLKNGTLTSSCTNDPRFAVLNVNSDAVVERMTISQPANNGAHEIVYVGSSKLTMIDSTITYVQNGTASARAIDARGATLLFYGDNFMNTVSSGSYDWNIMQNCNCYFYSGTLEVNYHFALYSSSTKVYFCGGAVKNTRSGDGVFSGLKSADYVILNNGDDNYAIYSDEAYTNPITATQVLSATAIYSKKVNKYTVTWLDNDGTTSLGTSTVTEGNSPIYNGETTKDGENGIKYKISGWTDGTNTYGLNNLPAVTDHVTYTAVYDTYYKFNLTDELSNATITVTDKDGSAIQINDGSFFAKVGSKITSSLPLNFDGATATRTTVSNNYVHTITALTSTPVTVTEGYTKEGEWWGVKVNGTLEIFGNLPDDIEPNVYNGERYYSPWGTEGYWSRTYIKKIIALPGAKAGKNSLYKLFRNHTEVTEIDMSNLDVSNAENMSYAFQDCRAVPTINLTGWDTSKVTDMSYMFYQCNKLTSLDLSHFNTSNVTDMKYMFCNTGLQSLNISNWDTSKVTDMFAMFAQCYYLESTDNITGWSGLNTSNVTNMQAMFNTSKFKKIDVSNFDTRKVENMSLMFSSCTALENIVGLDKFDTPSLTNTGNMFAWLTVRHYDDYTDEYLGSSTALKMVDLSSFTFNSNVNTYGMFSGSELETLKISDKFAIDGSSQLYNSADTNHAAGWFNESGEMVSGEGNYAVISGQTGTLRRSEKSLLNAVIANIPDQNYTGSAITPPLEIIDGTTTLVEDTDYTVTFKDNTNVGKATATIIGIGKYAGKQEVNFTIKLQDLAELDVKFDFDGDGTAYAPANYSPTADTPSIDYDGKEYTPTAKLILNNAEVPEDSYDLSLTSGKNADTYTITFTAKDNTNFTGTRTFDWDITKADMTITMTDGLSFNRVGGKVAGECVDESKFAVTGAPDGSTTTLIYFSEQGRQLPKVPTEAGNYIVKAVVTNDNYNDGEATATFTIISNQSGEYYFLKTANNTMLITGYAGDSAEAVIPETINGLPVKGIYYYAFEDSNITSVTIPESVDMIYSYAFKNAKKLTDVYYKGSKTEWKKEVTISNGNNLLKNATIHYALPENIYFDRTSLETTVGKSVRLLVSVSPVGTPADFTWESSDEKVATVDENGNVTTLDFGTATITATADNGKTAVCELTVGHNGSNGIFEYTVSDDKEVTLTKYIGTSDTVEVADKIDDMPIVAIAEGTFAETPVKTINYTGSKTMWEELFTGELAEDITVNYALPTSISLDATAEVTKADTITLTPTVTPADTATTFTWTSDDETIATVDENGVVTGVAYGTVDITATADNGQTATCAVTVTNIGEKDDFEYEIVTTDDEDTITITKYNGSDEEVNIPETINGISVTAIGAEAFKDNETMKDVIILLNVETIGDDAFAGCNDELNIHGYRRTDSERYATENNVNFVAIPYPLKNASTISSKHTNVNEKVTLTGVGVEGTLEYTYAVYYKLTDAEKWTVKQNYNANNVVELSLAKEGTYNVCIKVKDTDGKIAKKYFVLYVTQPLANTSSISADTIILGESFTVNMSAKNGSDTYKYAVYTKKAEQTSWTKVQGYADSESVTVTPEEAGLHNVCIRAKDGFGTISKKYFIVNVKNVAPQNISTISAPEINVSESLTICCDAELGAGSFRYAVYTKNIQDAKWVKIQKFDDNSELSLNFEKPGLYQICVKAKDADNTIAKKYFTVTVTKDVLVNNSTISADEIMLGESIEVNAVSEGGFGAYKYAVYYKLSKSSKWTTVQQFDANGNVTITPTKAGRYEICVKVKDETGEIVKKYFMAEVKYEPLVNKCTLSAEEVNFGETLTVTANAENGSGEYKYAVYIKPTKRTAWNTVQDFSEQTEINVAFKNKGAYDICIKVMDSYGTVSKTYTSVYVK